MKTWSTTLFINTKKKISNEYRNYLMVKQRIHLTLDHNNNHQNAWNENVYPAKKKKIWIIYKQKRKQHVGVEIVLIGIILDCIKVGTFLILNPLLLKHSNEIYLWSNKRWKKIKIDDGGIYLVIGLTTYFLLCLSLFKLQQMEKNYKWRGSLPDKWSLIYGYVCK